MKKLLLLLLIAPVLGFGQVLTDVFYVWQKYDEINPHSPVLANASEEYFFVVPDDKIWVINFVQQYSFNDSDEIWVRNDYSSQNNNNFIMLDIHSNPTINGDFNSLNDYSGGVKMKMVYFLGDFIPSGTKFYYETVFYKGKALLSILEYSLDGNSLSYNEPETIKNDSNTPVLFPNPTSSLLALNSDKEYDIEVYDMAGNKVMALTGNTIDMSHLSSATYIVKALDKVKNEEVSYKVVKN
ncbi:MAG: T9SS type A sorting domain-containing protein [Flavobacteriaceae bacterium]|nr:T9SS type A sorting domain-containing protein [Flavobacteriaceae bacterium]